jgi:hypothetical protein
MRPSQTISKWTQLREVWGEKWVRFTGRFLSALAEEEMKLRREEILKQIRAQEKS